MSFSTISKDLGSVRIGRDYYVTFPYKGIKINKIEMSCDCLSYEDLKNSGKLVITWKPKPIPVHLKELGQDFYTTQKSITVSYTVDNKKIEQVILLTFQATVKE